MKKIFLLLIISVFSGCGMALDPEDTPYLEILCVRDPRDEAGGMEMRDEESVRRVIEEISEEKQNSLIALAWSKPAHGHEQTQVHLFFLKGSSSQ